MTDFDHAAVQALADERLDWRSRSLPADLSGLTVAEALARRPDLRDFPGPVVALDAADLEHNTTAMARWCARRDLSLAPHGKTSMAPALFARQLAAGAWGITVATAAQARVCREFGVRRVLLANQLVDPAGLAWLRAELDRDPFHFLCWVDSAAAVEILAEGLGGRAVDVLVELGSPGGRTGVRTVAEGLAVASAARSAGLRVAGVGGYEGPATDVTAYLGTLRELAEALRPSIDGEMVVTAGGSTHFDEVARTLPGPWRTVLRSGAYIAHDDGHYAAATPHTRDADAPDLRSAWRVWAQVHSLPEPGRAILGAGKRDLPQDLGLPRPLHTREGVPVDGEITALDDHHAYLTTETELRVGEWVRLGISHPCTLFDRTTLIPVVAEDGITVVDLLRTFF
ncbi:alanine racemase [Actinokineospora sp. G85]|uniref:alanine racemase n=1 Tax=Actinokineospora sp. G85 TaxID=3406626 RepID=UPI003C79274A